MLLLSLVLLIAATAAAEQCFLRPPTFQLQDATIRLVVRDWPSHQLVTQVAAILLREQLKYDVEMIALDSAPLGDYERLARGDFDANVELWPTGKEHEFERWVTNSTAVVAGQHIAVSEEGMYVPRYVVERDSTAAFYRSLQDRDALNAYSQVAMTKGESIADFEGEGSLCSRSEWNCRDFVWRPPHCQEADCRAQVLHGPTSYTQGKVEQQIAGNHLNLSVSYLSMRTLHEQVWEAYAGGKPVLFHHWIPQEAIHGLDGSHFVRVQFPVSDEECKMALADVNPTGKFNCDLPKQPLLKVVSPRVVTLDDAFFLMKALALDQADYDALFHEYEITNHDTGKAACRWLRHVGKARWGAWLQYSRSGPPMPMPQFGGCWLLVWVQAGLFFGANMMCRLYSHLKSCCISPNVEEGVLGGGGLKRQNSLPLAAGTTETGDKGFRRSLRSGRFGFLSFRRTEEEFAAHVRLPDSRFRGTFRIQTDASRLQLIWYAVESSLGQTLAASFKFACLIGMLGSLVHIAKEHAMVWKTESFLEAFVTPFARVVQDFGMLPAFMVALSVNANVSNWMTWLGHAAGTYGRICDVGLIIGGLDIQDDDAEAAETLQSVRFRFYRYLNALHFINYHLVDPRVGTDPVAVCDALANAGLLTADEAATLRHSEEMHTEMLVWLSRLWDQHILPRMRSGQQIKTHNFVENITKLRTQIGSCKGQSVLGPPDITRGMLYAVTCTLLGFILLSYPLTMYIEDQCFQWGSILCGTLYIFCYHGLLTMGDALNNGPFDPNCDCVNIDHLLCWADTSTFMMLRPPHPVPLKMENVIADTELPLPGLPRLSAHSRFRQQQQAAHVAPPLMAIPSNDIEAACI